MTPRERILAALDGKPTDRVPIWLLFPYHRLGCYADVRNSPRYKPVVDLADRLAVTLNRRPLGPSLFAPDVKRRREETREGGWTIRREIIEFGGKRLVGEERRREGETVVRKMLRTEEDLKVFAGLPVEEDPDRIRAGMDAALPEYLKEKAEFPAEMGAMMLELGEPICPLYFAADTAEYAVWSLTAADVVSDFLDRAMRRLRMVYEYCLERDLADVYFLIGSELASPPLVSRQTFRSWIVPYARELVGMIRSYGKRAIIHYHGQIKEILPDFLEIAPNAIHTIEAPPVGNCTFTEAFEIAGDRMALIGNIQYDCFRSYTPEEMAAAVRAILDECRGRRLILSPTAGPYEENISDRMVENYLVFLRTGWECGANP
ncbi:MAG: uroporphyrinogen decarboxylase family protein [Planctomycetota bacterium]|nr:uroporphyrinogen decarboxylase family protein [Planctomycetota bacterium]